MAERVVPNFPADSIPISGLAELQTHLESLADDVSQPFNLKLLDDVELQLNETNIPPLLPTLLPPLTTILKSTTQDPTPLVSLTTKLLSPLSLRRALELADPPSLLAALQSELPGANLLALAIIHKAAASTMDALQLSILPELVQELVRRWLVSPDVGVGERCIKVLGDILETDCEVVDDEPLQNSINGINGINGFGNALVKRNRTPGNGHIWRLIFLSEPTLSLIPSLCTPTPSRPALQTTLSQDRVLRLLPRLATLNIRAISRTPHPELFPLPDAAAETVDEGVLQWAALGMVDKEDVLMHLCLVDFFEALVSIMRGMRRDEERDEVIKDVVKTAVQGDPELKDALRSLPDRTVEEEAESLRSYITDLLA